MLLRREIIAKAIHDCMREMYAKSQPSADYDQLIEDYKNGKIGKDERVYERYYLSSEEFSYILDKYKMAYRFTNEWNKNINILKEYLEKGGSKDKFVDDYTDEYGNFHPAYRDYETLPPLKESILNLLKKETAKSNIDDKKLAEMINSMVMGYINDCQEFYRFDREDSDFSCAIALGASPTSNPKTVKEWWKKNKNIDIDIVERNPLLFWDEDFYEPEELEEIMTEEYGKNWREFWDNKWKQQKEKKEAKHKEFLEKK